MSGLPPLGNTRKRKTPTGTISAAEWKKQNTKEKHVRKAIRDLCAVKGWKYHYIVASALSDDGLTDLFIGVKGIGWIFVETKRPGGRLRDAQIKFQQECHEIGAPHLVADCGENLDAYVRDLTRLEKGTNKHRWTGVWGSRKPVYPMAGECPGV